MRRGDTCVVATQFLFLIELRIELIDTRAEIGWITSESYIEILQELVAASEQRLRGISASVNSWFAVKDDDSVGEVSCHNKIMLDDEGCLL